MAKLEGGAEVSGEESYVAKLTIKTLGCIPSLVKALKPEQGTKLAIARIFGKATKVTYQPDKDRGTTFTVFNGNFEGINLQDGTVLRSGKLFLPPGIQEVMENAIKTEQAKDPAASVSFAFEIRAVQATNPIGYSYEAASLKPPQAEDELSDLRAAIAKLPTHEQKRLGATSGGTGKLALEGQTTKKSA